MLTMLKNSIKNMFTSRNTVLYPFEQRDKVPNSRGAVAFNENCIYCGICMKNCPPNAIIINKETSIKQVDHYRCISCGRCEELCPKDAVHLGDQYAPPMIGYKNDYEKEKANLFVKK